MKFSGRGSKPECETKTQQNNKRTESSFPTCCLHVIHSLGFYFERENARSVLSWQLHESALCPVKRPKGWWPLTRSKQSELRSLPVCCEGEDQLFIYDSFGSVYLIKLNDTSAPFSARPSLFSPLNTHTHTSVSLVFKLTPRLHWLIKASPQIQSSCFHWLHFNQHFHWCRSDFTSTEMKFLLFPALHCCFSFTE